MPLPLPSLIDSQGVSVSSLKSTAKSVKWKLPKITMLHSTVSYVLFSPSQFILSTLKVFMYRLNNTKSSSSTFMLILNLTAAQCFLWFFLKIKPGRGLTQSIEVQLLVLVNNSGYPNAYSTMFFSCSCLQSVKTKKN